VKSIEVYWLPASLWWTSSTSAPCARRCSAIRKASVTRLERMWRASLCLPSPRRSASSSSLNRRTRLGNDFTHTRSIARAPLKGLQEFPQVHRRSKSGTGGVCMNLGHAAKRRSKALRVKLPADPEADLRVRRKSGPRKTLKRGDCRMCRLAVIRACGVEHSLDALSLNSVGLLHPSGLRRVRVGRSESGRATPVVVPDPKRPSGVPSECKGRVLRAGKCVLAPVPPRAETIHAPDPADLGPGPNPRAKA
jgi:hypothetical protein